MASRRSRLKVRPNIGGPKPSVNCSSSGAILKRTTINSEQSPAGSQKDGKVDKIEDDKEPLESNEHVLPGKETKVSATNGALSMLAEVAAVCNKVDANADDIVIFNKEPGEELPSTVDNNGVSQEDAAEISDKAISLIEEKKPQTSSVARRSRIKPQVKLRGRGAATSHPIAPVKNVEAACSANTSKPDKPSTCVLSLKNSTPSDPNLTDEGTQISTKIQSTESHALHKPDKAVESEISNVQSFDAVDGASSIPTVIDSEHAESKQSPVKKMPKSPLRRIRFQKPKPNLAEAGRNRIRHTSFSYDLEENPRKQMTTTQAPTSSCDEQTRKHLGKMDDNRINRERTMSSSVCSTSSFTEGGESEDSTAMGKHVLHSISTPDDALVKNYRKSRVMKKRRKVEELEQPVDRSKVTMRDLIYMIPVNNPMKSTVEETHEKERKEAEKMEKRGTVNDQEGNVPVTEETEPVNDGIDGVDNAEKEHINGANNDVKDTEDGDEDLLPVPQLRIGPDGNIIISEESLVIKSPKNNSLADSEIIEERENSFSFKYGRRHHSKRWTLGETKKFYVALGTVGTDFTLMSKFFAGRTRNELKRKFKREEKQNRVQIEMVLSQRHDFDVSILDEQPKEAAKPKPESKPPKPPKAPKKTTKKTEENKEKAPKKRRKGKSRYFADSDSESENVEKPAKEIKRSVIDTSKNASEGDDIGIVGQSPSVGKRLSASSDINTLPSQQTPSRHTAEEATVIPSTSELPANSSGKSPGQYLSLSSLKDMGKVGQFLFVKSNNTPVGSKGPEKSPSQVIHVYMVSPSGRLSHADVPGTEVTTTPQPCSIINVPKQGTSNSQDNDGFPTPAPVTQKKKVTSVRLQPPPPGWFSSIGSDSDAKTNLVSNDQAKDHKSPAPECMTDRNPDNCDAGSVKDGDVVILDQPENSDAANSDAKCKTHESKQFKSGQQSNQNNSESTLLTSLTVVSEPLLQTPLIKLPLHSPSEKNKLVQESPQLVEVPPVEPNSSQHKHLGKSNCDDVQKSQLESVGSNQKLKPDNTPSCVYDSNISLPNMSPPQRTTFASTVTPCTPSSSTEESSSGTQMSRIVVTDSPDKASLTHKAEHVLSPPKPKIQRRRRQKFMPKMVDIKVPLPQTCSAKEGNKTVVTDITDLVISSLGETNNIANIINDPRPLVNHPICEQVAFGSQDDSHSDDSDDEESPFIPSRMQTPKSEMPGDQTGDCIEEMVIDSDTESQTIDVDMISVEGDGDEEAGDRTIVCEVVGDDSYDAESQEEGNWIVVEFDENEDDVT